MRQIEIRLDILSVSIAEVIDIARGSDVEAIATALAGLAIIPVNYAEHAECGGGSADGRVRVRVAGLRDGETARMVCGHDIAASGVEDWRRHSRIGSTEGFPVAERGVQRGDEAVADENGFQWYLNARRVDRVLRYYLRG